MVIVYSKSDCQPCRLTKRAFDAKGVKYVEKKVDEDPEALAEIKSLGYLQVPVVVAGDVHWSGLNPKQIGALSESLEVKQ